MGGAAAQLAQVAVSGCRLGPKPGEAGCFAPAALLQPRVAESAAIACAAVDWRAIGGRPRKAHRKPCLHSTTTRRTRPRWVPPPRPPHRPITEQDRARRRAARGAPAPAVRAAVHCPPGRRRRLELRAVPVRPLPSSRPRADPPGRKWWAEPPIRPTAAAPDTAPRRHRRSGADRPDLHSSCSGERSAPVSPEPHAFGMFSCVIGGVGMTRGVIADGLHLAEAAGDPAEPYRRSCARSPRHDIRHARPDRRLG